jgi:hypothetical protein
MAHFAKLDDNNIVVGVNVVNNEDIQYLEFPDSEVIGIQFLNDWAGQVLNWKQTSYSASFRKNYAGVGYSYDQQRDAFIPPKPYASWILNEDTCVWDAPVPMPLDDKIYMWDEETISWKEVTNV